MSARHNRAVARGGGAGHNRAVARGGGAAREGAVARGGGAPREGAVARGGGAPREGAFAPGLATAQGGASVRSAGSHQGGETDRSATWERLVEAAAAALGSRREATWMVEHVSGIDAVGTTIGRGRPCTIEDAAQVDALVARRLAGEPLQYVLGRWAWRGLEPAVDRRVLIPRPETEVVATVALKELEALVAVAPARRSYRCVDLGTGSGVLALSLATEAPPDIAVEIWATDISVEACEVAAANLGALGSPAVDRVRIVTGSWFDPLPQSIAGRIDLAVSNPPYVADAELDGLDPEVRDWEPVSALVAGPTGLEAIGIILAEGICWLAEPGTAVVEIAPHQASGAVELARSAGFRDVSVVRDLAERDRVLVARR